MTGEAAQQQPVGDVQEPIQWGVALEQLLSADAERCMCYRWMHDRSAKLFASRNTCIAMPVIVLSTLSGTASIGATALFQGWAYSSIVIGLVSIFVGVLNTVGNFFGFAQRMEAHRIASITYGKLHRVLMVELALPRAQRMRAPEMLKSLREQLDRLHETAPTVPQAVIDEFKRTFPNTPDISKPDIANGLDNVDVFLEPITVARSTVGVQTDWTTAVMAPQMPELRQPTPPQRLTLRGVGPQAQPQPQAQAQPQPQPQPQPQSQAQASAAAVGTDAGPRDVGE